MECGWFPAKVHRGVEANFRDHQAYMEYQDDNRKLFRLSPHHSVRKLRQAEYLARHPSDKFASEPQPLATVSQRERVGLCTISTTLTQAIRERDADAAERTCGSICGEASG